MSTVCSCLLSASLFHFHHFYSAIFCHFGHREGISNAVAPLCSPLPRCASGLACEAGPEEGGAEGSRWALIHYWSSPIENVMEILPPTPLLLFSVPPVPFRLSLPSSYSSLMSPLCTSSLVWIPLLLFFYTNYILLIMPLRTLSLSLSLFGLSNPLFCLHSF